MEQSLYNKILYLVKSNNIILKKAKGQNFLIDQNIVNKIVNAASLKKSDVVIEIGPGLGSLTNSLLPHCHKVIAFELDTKVAHVLQQENKDNHHLQIINQDFLQSDLLKIKQDYKANKIVANLPYSVASLIIIKILQSPIAFTKIILMVQKEMAMRLMAPPGDKKYNALTIMAHALADIKILFDVSENCFLPRPKVKSCVISLQLKNVDFKKKEQLFIMIKKLFLNRRKTILNNLALYLQDKNQANNILKKVAINPSLRPQNLTLSHYEAIYEQIICQD